MKPFVVYHNTNKAPYDTTNKFLETESVKIFDEHVLSDFNV